MSESIKFPRGPWVLSKQYGMTFVLSQDNEIILGTKVCEALGDEMCEELIEWANARIRSLVWSERMENKTGGRIGEIN